MERFTLNDLQTAKMPWDERVPTTPGIDPWCTRLAWQLSVHAAFGYRSLRPTDDHEDDEHDDDESVYTPVPNLSTGTTSPDDGLFVATADWSLALRKQQFHNTNALVPLDAVWGFASPLLLTNGAARVFQIQQWANEVSEILLDEPDWELSFLAGLEPGSPLDDALIRALSPRVRLVGGEPTVRRVANLADGFDAYLSRRSRSFRRNLRQATSRATTQGLTIESVDLAEFFPHLPDPSPGVAVEPGQTIPDYLSGVSNPSGADAVMQRLITIESHSWKGREDSGITSPDMAQFYTGLINCLGPLKGIRLSIARQHDRDVGFILGGVTGGRYRGFQISFIESVRTLSVGNFLQLQQIENLCQEGVHTYDLGMDMEYKRAWSDTEFITRPIVAVRQ